MRLLRKPYKQANGLPIGYTEVEYLQSSGAQYINIGFTFDSTTDIIEIGYQNTSTLANKWLFGSYEENANIGISSANLSQVTFWYKGNVWGAVSSQYDKEHILRYDSTGMSNDGVNLKAFTSYTGTWNLYLFALNNTGTSPNGYYGFGKIFYYKQIRNNELILHLIPALDTSGKPCMYDLVGNKPYYNLGTDADFTYGKKIISVEYLESSGTQYINTGLTKGDSSFTAINDLAIISATGNNRQAFAGADWNVSSHMTFNYSTKKFDVQDIYSVNYTTTLGTRYIVEGTFSSSNVVLTLKNQNGTQLGTVTRPTMSWTSSNTNTWLIGSIHNKSQPIDLTVRFYANKIYQGSTLKRDYIPVKDENNVGYMFDKVSHKLYSNSGTGSFVVGDEVVKVETKPAFIVTRDLPAGFTEVEYLESSGTQYIDTGFKMEDGKTMTFEGNMMWKSTNGNANFFYGYRSVNSAEYRGDMRAFFVYGNSAPPAGRLAIRYGVNVDNSTSTISKNQVYKISFDGTNLKINDTTFISVSQTYTQADYKNMWLFNCNCTGYYSDDVAKFSGRIYYWKIWSGGVLVRDFIPCLDASNVPCMYDKVEGKAYYNAGTGSFTYGRKIIPVEYLEVPYSNNVYFQTIEAQETDKIIFDSNVIRTEATGDCYIARATNTYFDVGSRQNTFYIRFGSTSGSVGTNSVFGRHIYELYKEHFDIDGITKTSPSWGAIGGNWIIGSTGSAQNVRHYSIKIKNTSTNETRADFIPCKDENNVGFMFDRISHTLFANNGTGAFILGDDIQRKKYTIRVLAENKNVVPGIYQKVSYLENTGTQYINTGYKPNSNTKVEARFKMNETTDTYKWLFLSRNENVAGDGFGFGSVANGYIDSEFNNRTTSTTDKLTNGVIYNVVKDKNICQYNDKTLTNPNSTFTVNYPLTIFCLNNGSAGIATSTNVKANCYYFKIYDNGTLVRDYVPVVRKSDNKPGMYDVVNQVFYTNAGTGEFTYG